MNRNTVNAADTILGGWCKDHIGEIYHEDQEYLKMMGKYDEYLEEVAKLAVEEYSNAVANGSDELEAKEIGQAAAKLHVINTIKTK